MNSFSQVCLAFLRFQVHYNVSPKSHLVSSTFFPQWEGGSALASYPGCMGGLGTRLRLSLPQNNHVVHIYKKKYSNHDTAKES